MRHFRIAALLAAILPLVAGAQDRAPNQPGSRDRDRVQGDPVRGEVLAYTCTGCHGIPFYKNIYPTYTVPKLGGQNQQYLVNALKAYRDGLRRHPTMQAQASTLSDQDILDVTAYFVSFPGKDS